MKDFCSSICVAAIVLCAGMGIVSAAEGYLLPALIFGSVAGVLSAIFHDMKGWTL